MLGRFAPCFRYWYENPNFTLAFIHVLSYESKVIFAEFNIVVNFGHLNEKWKNQSELMFEMTTMRHGTCEIVRDIYQEVFFWSEPQTNNCVKLLCPKARGSKMNATKNRRTKKGTVGMHTSLLWSSRKHWIRIYICSSDELCQVFSHTLWCLCLCFSYTHTIYAYFVTILSLLIQLSLCVVQFIFNFSYSLDLYILTRSLSISHTLSYCQYTNEPLHFSSFSYLICVK